MRVMRKSDTEQISFRVGGAILKRLDRLADLMNRELPGAVTGGFGRSDAARMALSNGLKAEEMKRALPPIDEEPAQEQVEE